LTYIFETVIRDRLYVNDVQVSCANRLVQLSWACVTGIRE